MRRARAIVTKTPLIVTKPLETDRVVARWVGPFRTAADWPFIIQHAEKMLRTDVDTPTNRFLSIITTHYTLRSPFHSSQVVVEGNPHLLFKTTHDQPVQPSPLPSPLIVPSSANAVCGTSSPTHRTYRSRYDFRVDFIACHCPRVIIPVSLAVSRRGPPMAADVCSDGEVAHCRLLLFGVSG